MLNSTSASLLNAAHHQPPLSSSQSLSRYFEHSSDLCRILLIGSSHLNAEFRYAEGNPAVLGPELATLGEATITLIELCSARLLGLLLLRAG